MSFGTMLELTGYILYFGGWFLFIFDIWKGTTPLPHGFPGIFFSTGRAALIQAFGEGCWTLHNLLDHDLGGALFNALWCAGFLYGYFKNGGGKGLKKAAKELGEKSRMRVQALVDNLQPSPIPVPVGAR